VTTAGPESARPSVDRRKPDYVLLAATIMLLVLGTLMVYSASFVVAHNEFSDDAYFLTRQLVWVGIGSLALVFGMSLDYHRWRSVSVVIMLICIALLIAVLVPGIGSRNYGASRWLRLGSFFQVQPSELAKIAIVLYLSDWLARRGALVGDFKKGLLPFAIIVALVAGLVVVQPDLGTTSIIIGAAACVFFVAGANLFHVGLMLGGGVVAGLVALSKLSGYRQDRIAAFLDPWSDIQGSGWHTAQGLIALGSGGPLGRGLGESFQKFYWVPNAHTDAIFAIIGEELGFIGSVGLLVLFGLLAWRGFLIAFRAPDSFGRLYATGLTCMLILQAIVNIAVVTNSVPYTGITLPLVSFGGSSTVISLLAIGLLLNISRYKGVELPQEDHPYEPAPVLPPPTAPHARRGRARPFAPRLPVHLGLRRTRLTPQVTPVRARATARRRKVYG
jgi:cell division protein FtsW